MACLVLGPFSTNQSQVPNEPQGYPGVTTEKIIYPSIPSNSSHLLAEEESLADNNDLMGQIHTAIGNEGNDGRVSVALLTLVLIAFIDLTCIHVAHRTHRGTHLSATTMRSTSTI